MEDLNSFVNSISISCVKEFETKMLELQEFRRFCGFDFFYRGHSSRNFELKCGVFRDKTLHLDDILAIEFNLFQEFKAFYSNRHELTKPFKEEIRNDWHIYFQSQHLGLRTRLLDWSLSWQIALWFAVEDEFFNEDGSVWIFACLKTDYLTSDEFRKVSCSFSPFEYKENKMLNTPTYVERLLNSSLAQNRMRKQFSRFWIQSDENSMIPMNKQPDLNKKLFEIVIKKEHKARLKEELASFINNYILYDNRSPILEDVILINEKYFGCKY